MNFTDPTGHFAKIIQSILDKALSIAALHEKTPQHRAVQLALAAKVGGQIEVSIKGGAKSRRKDTYGYMDVVRGKEVWEVKPDSLYGIRTGEKQLKRYIAASGGTLRRGQDVFLEPIPYGNGTITTRFENGVVYYKWNQNRGKEPVPVIVPEPVHQSVEQREQKGFFDYAGATAQLIGALALAAVVLADDCIGGQADNVYLPEIYEWIKNAWELLTT